MQREERQQFWTSVTRDATLKITDRLRASELLGKSQADFTHNVKMEMSLEDELKQMSNSELAHRLEVLESQGVREIP